MRTIGVSSVWLGLLLLITCGAAPTTAPSDSRLWAKLDEIDSRAAKIQSLAADFEQKKFTALLRKPLVSSGRVRVRGSVMRWDTQKPEETVLYIDPREARVYYPRQKALEVYPLDSRLGELAASPLPRLAALRERFEFEQVPAADLDRSADARQFIALKLTPKEASLRQYVTQVRVLLDVKAAHIVVAEVTDGDGERTVLRFSRVQINPDLGDLELKVPPGTRVSHPLEGIDQQAPPGQGKSK